jgi:hypothetical protein
LAHASANDWLMPVAAPWTITRSGPYRRSSRLTTFSTRSGADQFRSPVTMTRVLAFYQDSERVPNGWRAGLGEGGSHFRRL